MTTALLFSAVSYAAGERVLTRTAGGHLIHNRQIFSPDDRFIYYDSRNDETKLASSNQIGRVEIATGREEILYETASTSRFGPGTGAVACSPVADRIAFIHGLPDADEARPYAPFRRFGATLAADHSLVHLDARDVSLPFTSGALQGGTHAFHWSPDGSRLSFTYNDSLNPTPPAPDDLRTIGVMRLDHPVTVTDPQGPGEFSGTATAALVVPVTAIPTPGSDQLSRAFDEDWVTDHRIAFQGRILTQKGTPLVELFIATLPSVIHDIPARLSTEPGRVPTTLTGVTIQRLTHTETQRFPGLQGPRHWVRSSPDGATIAFLARDPDGLVQIHGVNADGTGFRRLSRLKSSVESSFDWSPSGRFLACIADGRVQLIDSINGSSRALTPPCPVQEQPRVAVVFSRKGDLLAYNRLIPHPDGGQFLQICLAPVNTGDP